MSTLIYFLLWAGVFFVLMRYGCGAHVMGHQHGKHDPKSADPPSGPSVDKPATAATSAAAPIAKESKHGHH